MPTIADVATRAGVGTATVSRVLNHSPLVREATREKVLAVITELDYHPSRLARGLSRGRSHTLGVAVPFFTQPSAVQRLRGVADALSGSRYDLVLFNIETAVQRSEHLAALVGRDRTDGLLAVSLPMPADEAIRFESSGVPVVLVDAAAPGLTCVVTDDVAGGRLATDHLVGLGHERIAFVGDVADNALGFCSSQRRLQGYTEVLDDAGLERAPEYVKDGPHERQVAHRLTDELLALPVPPTAVFAASDTQALGVLEAARSAGVRVPEQLSVIGFDDIEVSPYVGLTTIHQPLYESGFSGATLLLERLDGNEGEPASVELALELVVRTTTAPPPRPSQ